MNEEAAKKSKEAPDAVKPLESVAKGYKYYLDYLKSGGSSAISSVFGKAADILPEEMRAKPKAAQTAPKLTKEKVDVEQSTSSAEPSKSEPPENSFQIAEDQYVELGALKTALDVLKLDWAKLKAESYDPIQMVEKFDQCVDVLNAKYHQEGYLKHEFSIVGFLNSVKPAQLLVSQIGSENVFGVDPETGSVAASYRTRSQFSGIRLDQI